MQFSAKKNTGCPKAPRDFPPRKDGILHPRRVALGLPSPSPRVCTGGLTLTPQPNFLGSIGYQIWFAMVRGLRYKKNVHLAGFLKKRLLKIWPFSPERHSNQGFMTSISPQTTQKQKREGKELSRGEKRWTGPVPERTRVNTWRVSIIIRFNYISFQT